MANRLQPTAVCKGVAVMLPSPEPPQRFSPTSTIVLPPAVIAQAASLDPTNTPRTPSQPEILWRDDNFTAYLEKNNPVSSKGHIIILFNLHVPSIYSLSSTDLPLLVQIQRRGQELLRLLNRPSTADTPRVGSPVTSAVAPLTPDLAPHVGFITPPFKDNKIPVTDHLHAHAYLGAADLAGWWRKMAYGYLGWYAIEDLIAEIRESTTNNRVKSGHPNRGTAPIDSVPQAGARSGLPNGVETTERGLAIQDLEEGLPLTPPDTNTQHSPSSSLLQTDKT